MLSVINLDETRLNSVLASSGRRGPRFKSGLPEYHRLSFAEACFLFEEGGLASKSARRFIDEPKWTAYALHF